MKWKTFKEEMPNYGKPIFVYKDDGIFNFFKTNDDIRRCTLHSKKEDKNGLTYYLKGYEYGGSMSPTAFSEKKLLTMEWLEVPKRRFMKEEDKVLLDVYMWGFNDELDGSEEPLDLKPLLLRAYDLGRLDAAVGDDVSSVDQQTNEEIINRIKNK